MPTEETVLGMHPVRKMILKGLGTEAMRLYAFGSLLAFMFSHASILSLRIRRPELERPFKLGWNLRIAGRELPVSAIIGVLATSTIWTIILITQPISRWAGLIWMLIGLVIYYLYQRRRRATPTITSWDKESQSKKIP